MTTSPDSLHDATGQPLVHAVNVLKSFHGVEVLKGIDIDVHRGEVVCLLGPSGSGKTTFLRCINQLESIDGGRIWVDGELIGYREDDRGVLHRLTDKQIAAQRRGIGMVFQRFNLFPHMTALENIVEAPMQVKGVSKKDATARALQLLDEVGLGDKPAAYPGALSGGQQQRVAIARALVNDPAIIMADEPTGNLDSKSGKEIMELLLGLNRDRGTTVIIVTHDKMIADQTQRIINLYDGLVVEEGG